MVTENSQDIPNNDLQPGILIALMRIYDVLCVIADKADPQTMDVVAEVHKMGATLMPELFLDPAQVAAIREQMQ